MDQTQSSSFVDLAKSIAANIAAPAAESVDRDARFPLEAIEALKKAKLMSAYVPKEFGGGGVSLTELTNICEALGTHCTSTAMIFAMHQIQVACIIRHEIGSPWYQQYLRDLVEHQFLIASVTSEVGVGGEMRKSLCGIEIEGERFTLHKDASTISYGAYADDLLITARRNASAQSSDQSLVLIPKKDYTLVQKGVWDTMGMRGTCSPPFKMESHGHVQQIFTENFADIASKTMVPYSHILWAGCWLGIAAAAVGKARSFVQAQARQSPGKTPPTALRFAELSAQLHTLRSSIRDVLNEYEGLI
ncbi:MAG: acyl-CoA/acyl-ACP dehydrogenase, partial [Proteobacteria bacterium]|nr:acyl-CoA/acyl-ACP dehydrogenase [Pseudomonadota bacterium]